MVYGPGKNRHYANDLTVLVILAFMIKIMVESMPCLLAEENLISIRKPK